MKTEAEIDKFVSDLLHGKRLPNGNIEIQDFKLIQLANLAKKAVQS